ncbi:YpoC family protein [Anaeromicropila herbilytica]|uniref:YpoC-like domain-containing protein n=1 Tax=Anaeromicropila herbilytica TaxID=2785025 RepID=A0A7R7EHP9_9FIRM|nr:DUF4037 domain-containing protein [Anaeromicropila herbilytica]BCN29051.1 hypothetical protein bsdtb5_03460 [Anaeromicropila herbilytica]
MNVIHIKDKLVSDLSGIDKIKGIGQTGDMNADLIPGNSDIDMFVLCSTIPTENERKSIYTNYANDYSECMMNVCNGGIWGYGDILIIDGIDVMFMYFTIEEMEQYLDKVLNGDYLDRDGGFYPTGRLSSVENINILYESKDEWSRQIEKVKKYPTELFKKLFDYHISNVINDEDLGRVILRKEVMFYHSVLENSLDHLLQALFAVNATYFPSRKRSEQYIKDFKNKPVNCYERLIHIIQNSVSSNTIAKSVEELKKITLEMVEIGNSIY